MPRRGNVPKREILPDPVYNSVLVTKLINSIMLDGKKGVAQKVVYDAFHIIEERRQTLGLRWLTGYARKRSEKTMKERLAGEIMDACNNTGASVKKREDMHKMAESNKAFAHFRW